LGAIKANSSLSFQVHLRWTCDILPPNVQASIPPFEQLLERNRLFSRKHLGKHAWAFIFQHRFKVVFQLSLCLAEILCRARFGCLVFCPPSHPMFWDGLWHFLLSTMHRLGLPHPTACGLSQCICGQTINLIGIHLFHYAHGGKCTATHDAIQDSFTSIARNVGFHVLHKQMHVLPMPSLQWSQWQVDIVFTTNGTHILVNVNIVNSILMDLVLQVTFSGGMVAMIVA
jgi:hypothetical protein